MVFRKVNNFKSESKIAVKHGDVLVMSQNSQALYEHCIPRDYSKNIRISVTLRKISDPLPPITLPPRPLPSATATDTSSSLDTRSQPPSPPKKTTTVYVSSSMFTPLKEHGLSSDTQDAVVFSYPGANVQGIGEMLKNDPRAKLMDTAHVTNIIVLCGSNNVDTILGSPNTIALLCLGICLPELINSANARRTLSV